MGDHHDKIRRMYSELRSLLDKVPEDAGIDLTQTHVYLNVGELQLALDDMAYVFMEIFKPVPADIISKFDELGTEMRMKSGYPWDGLRELLGITGEVDEDA